MPFSYVEYRLAMTGPLRLGHAHRETAAACPRLHSDLLWRALAHAHAELFGRDLAVALPGWPDTPAFRISSALPFTAEHGPLAPAPGGEGLVRVGATGEPVVMTPGRWWVVAMRGRAAFNRRTARRDVRFAVPEVRFADDAGLWLGVRFARPEARNEFEAALRYLGDCGIGGGRSTGAGTFRLTASREVTVPVEDSAGLWCLSRYRPTEGEYADGALLGASARPVWSAWDVPGSQPQQWRYLSEGSVLTPHDRLDPAAAGTVTPVTMPDGHSSDRAGLLFALPLATSSTPVA